jgi:hypothetical protein
MRPFAFEITAGDCAFATVHRRIAISLLAGTLNSIAAFSIAAASNRTQFGAERPPIAKFAVEKAFAPVEAYPAFDAAATGILVATKRRTVKKLSEQQIVGQRGVHLLSRRLHHRVRRRTGLAAELTLSGRFTGEAVERAEPPGVPTQPAAAGKTHGEAPWPGFEAIQRNRLETPPSPLRGEGGHGSTRRASRGGCTRPSPGGEHRPAARPPRDAAAPRTRRRRRRAIGRDRDALHAGLRAARLSPVPSAVASR